MIFRSRVWFREQLHINFLIRLRFHRRDRFSRDYTGSWTLLPSPIGTWDHRGGLMPLVLGIHTLGNRHISEGSIMRRYILTSTFQFPHNQRNSRLLLLPSWAFFFLVPATSEKRTKLEDDELENEETKCARRAITNCSFGKKNDKICGFPVCIILCNMLMFPLLQYNSL